MSDLSQLSCVSRYGRTVVYLKTEQAAYQAWYRLRSRLPRFFVLSRPGSRRKSTPACVAISRAAEFIPRDQCLSRSDSTLRFQFLNEMREFRDGAIDWSPSNRSRLWRYNLHYFDYLRTNPVLTAEVALALMNDWVARNPEGSPDAWDPYPTSLRIVNWIKFLSAAQVNAVHLEQLAGSLRQQSLWLEHSQERHLLANHFFKNLKALTFAGLFFRGKDADRLLAKGVTGLHAQIGEQILPDGGHFERSPMYHSMILEDCLDLLNVCSTRPETKLQTLSSRLAEVTDRMVQFLSGVVHPDAQIPLFNDSAFGIEPDPASLSEYYRRLVAKRISRENGKIRAFPDSGYFVMQPCADDFLIIDCGAIGPDYQPGHSHCDTLSFELSLNGRRVIIDSGCYEYEDGEMRRYNRGNMGHNTLTVDGQDQSEVWGSHRCGRRAYPIYAELKELRDGTLVFEGAHDGYRRLRGKPVHRRKIVWTSDSISIEDTVEGKGIHDIELRLHVNPELSVDDDSGRIVIIHDGKRVGRITALGDAGPRVETGWYCPEFGKRLICPVICIALKKASLPLKTGWRIEAT